MDGASATHVRQISVMTYQHIDAAGPQQQDDLCHGPASSTWRNLGRSGGMGRTQSPYVNMHFVSGATMTQGCEQYARCTLLRQTGRRSWCLLQQSGMAMQETRHEDMRMSTGIWRAMSRPMGCTGTRTTFPAGGNTRMQGWSRRTDTDSGGVWTIQTQHDVTVG